MSDSDQLAKVLLADQWEYYSLLSHCQYMYVNLNTGQVNLDCHSLNPN